MTRKGGAVDIEHLMSSGAGWTKLQAIIQAQGGRLDVFDNPIRPAASIDVLAAQGGRVVDIDALAIGCAAMRLGAGREHKDDTIDPLAGIEIAAPVGSRVMAGDPIAHLYARAAGIADNVADAVRQAFVITDAQPAAKPLLLEELSNQAAE
jgi:thymidine phosphorylase